jgi:hypothetical protein
MAVILKERKTQWVLETIKTALEPSQSLETLYLKLADSFFIKIRTINKNITSFVTGWKD